MEVERGRVDVAVVGSLNFDLTLRTPRMPHPGEAVAATDFRSGPGGKGLNQAIAAARQGATAALIGCLGTDPAGDEMVAALSPMVSRSWGTRGWHTWRPGSGGSS